MGQGRRGAGASPSSGGAPNLVARHFEPPAAKQVWAGDVTSIATAEGWLYLAVLLDLYSRRVVGWALSDSNDTHLALAALHRAVATHRFRPGLVHHTDRGSPYASDDYQKALTSHAIIASMSRKADCWDNAVAESLFASLRAELVDHEHYLPREATARSTGHYDDFYNVQRLHSHLDYVSPVEF